MSDVSKEIKDFLDTPIVVGSLIVYASMNGQSPRLTLGEVLEIREVSGGYPYRVKIQPIADSAGRRWSSYKYNKLEKKGSWDNPISPVTLKTIDKLMVIE